ncbi:Oidioi.mRNA.OKI2018_I69.chr1.g1458.t2.cds [Oikopleura dioica]|nr:Oidioi.mRNA.OKI2018_I69.chr1.g1458.t2.cds [Oikopleura dioica]
MSCLPVFKKLGKILKKKVGEYSPKKNEPDREELLYCIRRQPIVKSDGLNQTTGYNLSTGSFDSSNYSVGFWIVLTLLIVLAVSVWCCCSKDIKRYACNAWESGCDWIYSVCPCCPDIDDEQGDGYLLEPRDLSLRSSSNRGRPTVVENANYVRGNAKSSKNAPPKNSRIEEEFERGGSSGPPRVPPPPAPTRSRAARKSASRRTSKPAPKRIPKQLVLPRPKTYEPKFEFSQSDDEDDCCETSPLNKPPSCTAPPRPKPPQLTKIETEEETTQITKEDTPQNIKKEPNEGSWVSNLFGKA